MMLSRLSTQEDSAGAVRSIWPLMEAMYPICRSITGNGVRQTLDLVANEIPLERTEVPTGTKVLDWEIPNEWNIRDAWIADANGRRVVDFPRPQPARGQLLRAGAPHDDARGAQAPPVLAP
jgi:aminopeptidase-like protein